MSDTPRTDALLLVLNEGRVYTYERAAIRGRIAQLEEKLVDDEIRALKDKP